MYKCNMKERVLTMRYGLVEVHIRNDDLEITYSDQKSLEDILANIEKKYQIISKKQYLPDTLRLSFKKTQNIKETYPWCLAMIDTKNYLLEQGWEPFLIENEKYYFKKTV